jgi:outer membrane protein OmpA-like peptidoglycan-associated protein
LTDKQVDRLTAGIWWKNTNENFAHLGLISGPSLQHVEDMITNITHVLLTTGAISRDPTNGQPNILYYPKILAKLQSNNFHPGVNAESIRKDSDNLPVLADADWEKLIPVGTLEVPTLVFARSRATLTEQSEVALNELIEKLKSWPQYYCIVRGNASLQGDLAANKALASARAKTVEQYLLSHGIGKTRVKAVAVEPSGSTSVVFQLGYTAY